MPKGGYRPNAGRKPGVKNAIKEPSTYTLPPDVRKNARKNRVSPLEYMERVINDSAASDDRRDRLAIAAAPYRHKRAGEDGIGIKEQRNETAKETGVGKFATPPAPPRLAVNNG